MSLPEELRKLSRTLALYFGTTSIGQVSFVVATVMQGAFCQNFRVTSGPRQREIVNEILLIVVWFQDGRNCAFDAGVQEAG